MSVAVANRPVEQFETTVPMPDWQLEPEEEYPGGEYIDTNTMPMVDENGNPIPGTSAYPGSDMQQQQQLPPGQQPPPGGLTQQWLDNVLGGNRDRPPQPRQPGQQVPPPATPSQPQPQPPKSGSEPNPAQPRAPAPQ
jgi:penicillin-binding protein 1A